MVGFGPGGSYREINESVDLAVHGRRAGSSTCTGAPRDADSPDGESPSLSISSFRREVKKTVCSVRVRLSRGQANYNFKSSGRLYCHRGFW